MEKPKMPRYPRYINLCKDWERSLKLLCFICRNLTTEDSKKKTWKTHIDDPIHRMVLEKFNESFYQSTAKCIICKICSKSIVKGADVTNHAIEHKLAPWYKPPDVSIVFFINFIAQIDDQYYCHLCEEQFSFWYSASLHVKNHKHQQYLSDKIDNDIDNETHTFTVDCQLLIRYNIFRNNLRVFECVVCKRSIGGHQNIDDHIKGRLHLKKQAKFSDELLGEQEKIINNGISSKNQAQSTNNLKTNRRNTSSNIVSHASKVEPKSGKQKNLAPNLNTKSCVPALKNNEKSGTEKLKKTAKSGIKNLKQNEKSGSEKLKKTTKSGTEKLKQNAKSESKKLKNKRKRSKKLKSDAKSDSKELASPSRQLVGVVYGLKDSGGKVTCEICNKVVQGLTKLHVHLTGHLWQSFTQNSKKNETLFPESVDENLLSELNLNNMSINQPGRDSLDKTVVASSEVDGLNKQLSRLDISTKEESTLIDNQVEINEELDKLVNDESPRNPFSRRSKNFANKKLPTQDDDSKFSYIYEIDEKQLEDIQLGTKLSFVLNGTNNIFCLICRVSVQNSVGDIYEHFSSIKHNRYLEQMQSDDLICRTCPGTLSDLQLAREYIEDRSNLHVYCWACCKPIENNIDNLEQHIESDVHKNNCVIHSVNSEKLFESLQARMSRNWYNVEVYWCIICDELFSDEIGFINHLSELAHEKKYLYYISEELTFDFCTTCATLWFGFQYSFAYHSQCKMHKYLLKDHHYHLTELPKGTPELLTAPDNFCNELLAEIDCNVDDEKLKEELLMKDLEKITKKKFPNATIYPFGSRVSGLGFKDSDLDVFIDCNKWYNKSNISNGIMDCLRAITKSLQKHPDEWTIDRTVTENVRIPIIKTHHKPTGIQCDISFSNGLTIENTKLIKSYIDMYSLCRKLIIFMKTWIKKCNLYGYKGLSSYAVTWMVIFFLQCKKILPSVNELIALKKQSRLIGGWEVGVIEQFEVQSSNQDFMQLLKEFFIFYSQFNYKYEVMSPLLGETIEKEKFISLELPTAMNPYIKYLEQKESEKFCVFSTMCLQDPFDLSHNLTKSISKFTIYQLKTFCFLSAQLLENHS